MILTIAEIKNMEGCSNINSYRHFVGVLPNDGF